MGRGSRRGWGITLAVLAVTLGCIPYERAGGAQEECAAQTAAHQARILIPGGQAVGVALKTQGVLVVAKGSGKQKTPLREGDVILSAGGTDVSCTADLSACIASMKGNAIPVRILRGNREMTVTAPVPVDEADGRRRLGVWVRDSTAGVGTLSYVDPVTGAYGALGHAIVDADTGVPLSVADGALLRATGVGVTRGENGKAGELRGNFLKAGEQIGTLKSNGAYGIYGVLDKAPQSLYPDGLPVGTRGSVHPGEAQILSTVDGGQPDVYAVEIIKCVRQDEPAPKGIVLRVTDERLLKRTGGIVQGMSGSPIIQDGHIVGAVTHVCLDDSAQGYGMYIEWMLDMSDRLGAVNEDAAA